MRTNRYCIVPYRLYRSVRECIVPYSYVVVHNEEVVFTYVTSFSCRYSLRERGVVWLLQSA